MRINKTKQKVCRFSDNNNIVYTTYSRDEYDRLPIDSTIYKKSLNKIPLTEWNNIVKSLILYKKYEMIVHINQH